mgnify:FL=1
MKDETERNGCQTHHAIYWPEGRGNNFIISENYQHQRCQSRKGAKNGVGRSEEKIGSKAGSIY